MLPPPAPMVTLPFAPCVTAVTASASPSRSESLARTAIVTARLSCVCAASSFATGGRLVACGTTVIETVAGSESNTPSFAV
jgi:hypothetical protein